MHSVQAEGAPRRPRRVRPSVWKLSVCTGKYSRGVHRIQASSSSAQAHTRSGWPFPGTASASLVPDFLTNSKAGSSVAIGQCTGIPGITSRRRDSTAHNASGIRWRSTMVQQKRLFSVAITIAVAISASAGYCVSEAARLARPSPEQLLWQDHEIGMFIHFSMNTWQDQEGDDLSTPLSTFNPGKLDTDQWAQVAANMGAGFVVLVAKHVGGFCLWPTQTTDYSIKNTLEFT